MTIVFRYSAREISMCLKTRTIWTPKFSMISVQIFLPVDVVHIETSKNGLNKNGSKYH